MYLHTNDRNGAWRSTTCTTLGEVLGEVRAAIERGDLMYLSVYAGLCERYRHVGYREQCQARARESNQESGGAVDGCVASAMPLQGERLTEAAK